MRNLFCTQTSPRCGQIIGNILIVFHPPPPRCTPPKFPPKVITLWNPVDEKVVPMAERWYRKIYSFCKGFKVCFLCERKLIFQFFYSFWNSPPGLDMWRGGKVHGRVEDEPGEFSSSNTFFSLENFRWPTPAQWSWRSSWPTRWFQNQRAVFSPLGTASLTRAARTPRLGAEELRCVS